MTNPYFVEPANPLQALMIGGQAFDASNRRFLEQQTQQGRLEAAQALQSGGDVRPALSKLIGIGDVKGADAVANYANQQAQRALQEKGLTLQGQQIAESGRHNRATEAQAATALGQAKPLTWGAGLYNPRTNEIIKEPGGDGAMLLDEPTLTQMAHQYQAGDTSVMTNLGRGVQGAANIVALRKKIAELNSQGGEGGAEQAQRNAEFFGAKAGARTVGVRGANIELAATEFNQVLPVVQKASTAVSRTNYPDLNKIIQAYQEHTGDPNIVAFGGAVNTLVNIYARAINPQGVGTVSDKAHAREILQKAWSSGQFDAAVGMMKQEIDAALNSPEKVREQQRQRFLSGQPGRTPQVTAPQPAQNPTQTIPAPPPGFKVIQ